MTDKQMIPNDSDPSFQLNCVESYASYSIWAAVHGTAFIQYYNYKNRGTILYPLCVRDIHVFPIFGRHIQNDIIIIIMITSCAGSCDMLFTLH